MTRRWIPPEPVARKAQAEKIHAILCNHLQSELMGKRCLEVGCGNGEITNYLAKLTFQIVGVEINGRVLRSNLINDNQATYVQGDGRQLPFEDSTFDIVILAQVYEHMTRQEMLSAEIYRVLKPGGVCFFSGPNRWRLIEPHYFLPFLSWLPQRCASRYLNISGRGEKYDIYPKGYLGLKRLWHDFYMIDYTWQIMKYPGIFGVASHMGRMKNISRISAWILKALVTFYPNFNWILVKENDNEEN
jgi:SAM-dependent methyltransferase